jgi:hypothetical protein
MPIGLYGECSLEFGVIVMNLKAMVPRMLDGVRRYLEVLCLASHQGHAFPTLIVLL